MADAEYDYIRDPEEIYRESFATIRREADLSAFLDQAEDVAVRMIHSCGMTDLVDDLVISPDAVDAGRKAIKRFHAIVCDVEMVRRGIIRRLLPDGLPVLCQIGLRQTATRAALLETTLSAAAMDSMAYEIAGGIVVIGNAPTALFHLLEMLENGCEPPALIIGVPVGFVGAEESKNALIEACKTIPIITVRGRRGGSAMAAAAMNAVAGGLNR
ncbi:MAG: precorrin-8X methylmutase [Alphaproteobacteria bacterium]|nr:precorrin-8X methylmutase [Alphaproteobacteria bacterium]